MARRVGSSIAATRLGSSSSVAPTRRWLSCCGPAHGPPRPMQPDWRALRSPHRWWARCVSLRRTPTRWTRSDLASAVVGAIGALKGPWHGGAPSEVVNQLHEMGSPAAAEAWIRAALARGERLMGFGHRVYRAYDPRAAALRKEAEGLAAVAGWLQNAIAIEEIALRLLEEHKPDYPIKTNVEYYAAAVLQGVGLPPNLFPATFALARHAGWTAHALEQATANVLIRPDVRYVGPDERHLASG